MKPTDDASHIPENGMSTTPRTDDTPCQATPSASLRQQIMDSRVPKNECEWWASRTITKLETELAAAKARAEKAEAEVERLTKHCSALEVEVAVLSEGLSEDHAIYIVKARAEKAEADTARLDWLEKEALEDWGIRSINRDAIDFAMKEASK